MKLNVTSTIIDSPSDEKHFLCTHLVVESDSGSMIVNCTSTEWGRRPVDRLDKERCPWYGQWDATFYHGGSDTPVLAVGLGDAEMETLKDQAPEYGIELFGIEALSKDTAILHVVNAVLWRLLQSPNHEQTPNVILKDRLAWAEWLMRTGITHGRKEGDFKVSRFFHGSSVERVYNYGAGSGLTVKSSLLTRTDDNRSRQTRLYLAGEHLYVSTKDFNADPERYVSSLKQPQPAPELSPTIPAVIYPHVMQTLHFLRGTKYSEELINQFINETNTLAEKYGRMQNNMYGGCLHNGLPAMQGTMPQQAIGHPMPVGYPTTPSAINKASETTEQTVDRLNRNFYY